jgi:hypothetical protein
MERDIDIPDDCGKCQFWDGNPEEFSYCFLYEVNTDDLGLQERDGQGRPIKCKPIGCKVEKITVHERSE